MALSADVETYSGLPSPPSSSSRYPAQWLSIVKEIKELYCSNQYKRCASQCGKTLQDEAYNLLPLHESFLHFYIAICNESLGLAAHKFSAKKLSYLHRAKDAFTAASVSLPLSCKLDNNGSPEAIALRSQSPQTDHFNQRDGQRSEVSRLAELDVFPTSGPTPVIKQSLHDRCDSGYDSEPDGIPDFKSYSARQPFQAAISDEVPESERSPLAQETPNPNLNEQQLRPRPLLIKKRTSDLLNPSSPVTHQPHLPPQNEYEPACLTQPEPAFPPPHPPNPKSTLLPTTKSSPTPTPTPTYTANLNTFQTHLHHHLTTISTTIAQTKTLQTSHALLSKSNRLASFWLTSSPALLTSSNKPNKTNNNIHDEHCHAKKEEEKEDAKRARIERLRSEGWRVRKEKFGWKGQAHYEKLREGCFG